MLDDAPSITLTPSEEGGKSELLVLLDIWDDTVPSTAPTAGELIAKLIHQMLAEVTFCNQDSYSGYHLKYRPALNRSMCVLNILIISANIWIILFGFLCLNISIIQMFFQKNPRHVSIQIMNVYECNGTNIFMWWKMFMFPSTWWSRIEWYISSFTSWKYLFHCTNEKTLIICFIQLVQRLKLLNKFKRKSIETKILAQANLKTFYKSCVQLCAGSTTRTLHQAKCTHCACCIERR